ncbi:MAG: RNA polymerase, sigma-24 subunit, ECF subfamily, RNA polymerase sigma-70 factor, ECF subfamily [Microgenomates group bacterium GW2011_GWC1_43_13]|uniref:RNA polymerase sigma factor n=2 Tax=Candidatus Woeseibacteriota TaxID=1752722 RepID=A0A837IJK3_9BACT|nr:MAG: RNA polymerase, sigma-24 subunit, ECF subfamily, RNA polymerase sigma-70 factor, ECF subfamily [Microgenomates group bacterium GW2011_GWC1_43_13]KKT33007.1 MAG: RNA polymerase, sigma-24 subunit, ECF subfamily [Candidatus Woesebacteria bacterium GW2011_GWB1_44_11]KKT53989.1 MAG: RNA polymerase, sigma-24 subunit, ECF subfamily [Candidatus Woesebacteria bacterium GW2011_GWA1_44_23]
MLHFDFSCVLCIEWLLIMPDDYGEYVKSAIAGDKEAFGELYRIFLNRIYRFVYYLVGDEFSAEDITQNTFLRAWRGLASFSMDSGTFQSYLYTIARNLVIDSQRKKKAYPLNGLEEVIESQEDPVTEVWKGEISEKIRQALADLDTEDRQIIILRYFEEMQFGEISEVVGSNPGAIRVKVHRLMGLLKQKLEGKI